MYKYSTYKFYLPDGRRIAAFAEETEQKNKMKVVLFYCSRKDQFSKKLARFSYDSYVYLQAHSVKPELLGETIGHITHPETIEITINPDKPSQSFLKYMEETFYKMDRKFVSCYRDTLCKYKDKGAIEWLPIKGAKLIPCNPKMGKRW